MVFGLNKIFFRQILIEIQLNLSKIIAAYLLNKFNRVPP